MLLGLLLGLTSLALLGYPANSHSWQVDNNGKLLQDSFHFYHKEIASIPLLDSKLQTFSSTIDSNSLMINEVEFSPASGNESQKWIEIFNPTNTVVDTSAFTISTIFGNTTTFSLPIGLSIEPKGIAVLTLDNATLSTTADVLVLRNQTGQIVDRTPLLIDRETNDKTWQRIPDGAASWYFETATMGRSNGISPNSMLANTTIVNESSALQTQSSGSCIGFAGCAEGLVVRIANPGTVYLSVNGTIFKVKLSLVNNYVTTDDTSGSAKADALAQGACLGNLAVLDQDDGQPVLDGSVVGAIYCANNHSLNELLLDSGSVSLDKSQCAISEFAKLDWAKLHGC
jgi:hypothetical protein